MYLLFFLFGFIVSPEESLRNEQNDGLITQNNKNAKADLAPKNEKTVYSQEYMSFSFCTKSAFCVKPQNTPLTVLSRVA